MAATPPGCTAAHAILAALNMNPLKNVRHVSSLLLLGFVVFHSRRLVGVLMNWNEQHGPSPWAVLCMFAFVIVHGRVRLGGRSLAALVVVTIVVTLVMEDVSIHTGLAGEYYYTPALGPKLDQVPVLIPLAWLMTLYPVLMTVETAAGGMKVRELKEKRGLRAALGWSAWLSFQAAFAMTAWDMGAEPIIVKTGEYIWKDGGPYFGVPISNFVAWVVISFSVAFCWYLFEILNPLRARNDAAPAVQAVNAYTLTLGITVAANIALGNIAPAMISIFVMSPYLLAAYTQLWRPS